MPERESVRDEKLDTLLNRLEEGTKAVFQTENWQAMLATVAKFHRYSLNNQILIAMQRPDATLVAGFRAWQTKFNRRVKRGEKGIQIIGYTPKTITTWERKRDERGVPIYGEDGQPVMERVKTQIPAYKVMYVFDVGQTEGEPLPSLNVSELTGDVERFEVIRDTLISLSPVPVRIEAFDSPAKGKMDFGTNQITVQSGMSQTQTIKTLVHEIAHAQMHGKDAKLSREARETEAESVAYILCQHLGIDSGEYSFPYLASWSNGADLPELQASLNRIREQAKANIEAVDKALEPLSERDTERLPGLGEENGDTRQELDVENARRVAEQKQTQPVSFADRLASAAKTAEQSNTQRMITQRGPLVQHTELHRRN